MMKRHIASWVLLAVFLPMLIVSSLHTHQTSQAVDEVCAGCVKHQCHGHLSQIDTTIHQCVLCHFLTLTFVSAAVAVVVCYRPKRFGFLAQRRQTVRLACCGVISLRAPPAV